MFGTVVVRVDRSSRNERARRRCVSVLDQRFVSVLQVEVFTIEICSSMKSDSPGVFDGGSMVVCIQNGRCGTTV